MTGNDVIESIQLLDNLHVHVWIDGGWAVDACLGSQTRPHADLDIVIEERDVDVVLRSLRERGFSDVPRDDTRAWNFVLGDPAGREIDFHVIVLDQHGQGIYGAAKNGDLYPADALSGIGAIAGRRVDCINPAWLVRFKTIDCLGAVERCQRIARAVTDPTSGMPRIRSLTSPMRACRTGRPGRCTQDF